MSSAYLLVAHGSRDPQSHLSLEHLRDRLAAAFPWPTPLVMTACLELAPIPLATAIAQTLEQCDRCGIDRLVVVPLFLSGGVHVREDIPAALASVSCPPHLTWTCGPHLGATPVIAQTLRQILPPDRPSLLWSHGSRQPQARQEVLALGEEVGAKVAFWTQEPRIEDLLPQLRPGPWHIQPHFLFPGTTTQALGDRLLALAAPYDHLHLQLGQPLAHLPAFGEMLAAYLQQGDRFPHYHG